MDWTVLALVALAAFVVAAFFWFRGSKPDKKGDSKGQSISLSQLGNERRDQVLRRTGAAARHAPDTPPDLNSWPEHPGLRPKPQQGPAETSGPPPAVPPAAPVQAFNTGDPVSSAPVVAPVVVGEPIMAPTPPSSHTATAPEQFIPDDLAVEEEITVVLRRQMPVRDEPPRSWLGGLPMMPSDVEWPTTDTLDDGPKPLNFVAQIACADLPPELWGGFGPRSGWLLLFMYGMEWDIESNPDLVRVLHVREPGPERQPPPGLGPVHDLSMSGPDYGYVRSQKEAPTVWRRWPVDIVTFPNVRAEGSSGTIAEGEDFSATLYGVADTEEARRLQPQHAPYTWRGALYVVDAVARRLADGFSMPNTDRDEFLAPGWFEDTRRKIEAEYEDLGESPLISMDPAQYPERADSISRARQRLAQLGAVRELFTRSGNGEALMSAMRQDNEARRDWWTSAAARVQEIRDEILTQPLDDPFPIEDWETLKAALEEDAASGWRVDSSRDYGVIPYAIRQSLADFSGAGTSAAITGITADFYVSPALRGRIPEGLADQLAPRWRGIHRNRPHRMGGLYDGVQTEPPEGPQTHLLLLQIATDDAMNWVWGDGGAYYFFIKASDLARGDFSEVSGMAETT